MPRKPRRPAPDAPATPEAKTGWSWGTESGCGAGTGGKSEAGRSTGAKASPGGKSGTGSKANTGSKASDGTAARSRAKGRSGTGPGTGGKAKAGARASAATGQGPTPKGMPGTRGDLSRVEVEAIREFALELARKGVGPDAVLICNPISEPSALPAKELLYDRCRWCETDIYYDRLMPSPPDMMRVCLKCGILLLEAEKKGKN